MNIKVHLFALLLIIFLCPIITAQNLGAVAPRKKVEIKEVPVPANLQQAREVFTNAWQLERDQNFQVAQKHYEAALKFFRQDKKYITYTMSSLNNMGNILARIGKYEESIKCFQETLQISVELKFYDKAAAYHHKLGILMGHLAKIQQHHKVHPHVIYQKGKKNIDIFGGVSLNKGVYVRPVRIGDKMIMTRIQVGGSINPFARNLEHYTKMINLKIRDDFDPSSLLVPDSVKFVIQVEKKGYSMINRMLTLLPSMEYSELDEIMRAKERKIKAEITEDYYERGEVNPDEISLTSIVKNELTGESMPITDQESFKPGRYRLTIRKAGYNPIVKELTLYPGEGTFYLREKLKSKLRKIQYRVQGDYTGDSGTDIIEPDEISLDGEPIRKDSEVKPGEYELVIRKEGFERLVEKIKIPPAERAHPINKFIRTLRRKILFQITGDYQKDIRITPDEVTFDGHFIKHGDSVKPKSCMVTIRKTGYDLVNKRILLPPKKEPFILQEVLSSTPRRVSANIIASFPKGQRLFPKAITLAGKEVTPDETFKPGEYKLYIQEGGYKPIVKTVNVEPSNMPFEINETMNPKARKVNLQIVFDVDPENRNNKPKAQLMIEKDIRSIELHDGKKVMPNNYVLRIEMPGYEPSINQEYISPSEAPHKITCRLTASMRSVVKQITAEYPAREAIEPDEISLDGKPIGKDFKIKPGSHDLVILKEGYKPIRKHIAILASDKDFLLAEQLETRTRLVSFEFRDSYDHHMLSPDEVILGEEKISHKEPQNLKPGKYTLRVNLLGYASVNKEVNVPVGSGPYKIPIELKAIKRDVRVYLTSDFNPEGKTNNIIPDVCSLNEGSVIFDEQTAIGKRTVKPDKYKLVISKAGYEVIKKDIEIVPNPKPHIIKEKLIAKTRRISLKILSSFTKNKMMPDTIMLDSEKITDGKEIKPGKYTLLIKSKGYKAFRKEILIKPAETPYDIEHTMKTVKVLLKYEITNDFDEKITTPDVITINETSILEQKMSFDPGKYTVKIEKLGFRPKEFPIAIEPSNEAYVIKTKIETIPREIELNTYYQEEKVDTEVAAFDGRDIRDENFKPGKYQLDIQEPGYFPIKKEITITPGEKPFVIEEKLKAKPRKVEELITFDVLPPEEIGKHKITMAKLDSPKDEKPVKAGDMIQPGIYILRVVKEAYRKIEKKKYIEPAEEAMAIKEKMIAKDVRIQINITYDVKPPTNLSAYKVSLIDKESGIARFVEHGKRAKPGSYYLMVQRPGYSFGPRKEIEILPSESPYDINEKLLANPRNITFNLVDKNVLVQPYKIIDYSTKKEITFKDTFKPGMELDLIVKFERYKTMRKRFRMVPGEGPFVAEVPLVRLKKYEFFCKKNEFTIDKIKYPFEFYSDGKKTEKHHMKLEKGVGKFYCEIFAAPDDKYLQVHCGYYFTQKKWSRIGWGIRRDISRWEAINVVKLIEHLKRVSDKDPRKDRAALIVITKMIEKYTVKQKIKKAHRTEIESLMRAVENFKGLNSKDRITQQSVLNSLERLLGN